MLEPLSSIRIGWMERVNELKSAGVSNECQFVRRWSFVWILRNTLNELQMKQKLCGKQNEANELLTNDARFSHMLDAGARLKYYALLSFGCRWHLLSAGRALSFHRDQLNVNCERFVFTVVYFVLMSVMVAMAFNFFRCLERVRRWINGETRRNNLDELQYR